MFVERCAACTMPGPRDDFQSPHEPCPPSKRSQDRWPAGWMSGTSLGVELTAGPGEGQSRGTRMLRP
jgi:hypothetical protein